MKKKLISLALAISMILSVSGISIGVDASDTGEVSEHTRLIEALGINEGIEKREDDALTRAEFAAMAVRLINANAQYEALFEDVTEDALFAKEIAAAKKLGVANGVSETQFAPSSPVTYGQAVKMIVSALGLDMPAMVGGGYPTGYYVVAKNLDILGAVSYGHDKPLTYADAKALIYNALLSNFVDVSSVKIDNPDSVLYYKETDVRVITKFFSCYAEEGIAWTAGKASMHIGEGKEDEIEVNGKKFIYSGSDIQSYLGLKVTVIYDKYYKALAVIESSDNKVYELKKDDIKEYTGSYISYYTSDNKVKKYIFDSGYTKLRNWRVTTENGFNFGDGKIVLIDNNLESGIDVVHIQSPDTIFVSSVSDGTVYDKNKEKPVKIEDALVIANGKDRKFATVDELLPNMILSVYKDSLGNVTYAEAGYNIHHGATIESLEANFVTIDDCAYEKSEYFKKYYNDKDIEVGSRITAYFDNLGKIAAIEKYAGQGIGGMDYGYLLGAKFDGSFGEVKLNILTADNEKVTFSLKSKVIVDGVPMGSSSQSLKDALINPTTGRCAYMLIKYSADEDKNITRIDTPIFRTSEKFEEKYAESEWTVDDSLTCFVEKGKAMYRGTGNLFPYCIYGSPVVFEVPRDLATNPNEIYEDDLFTVRQKNFTDNDKVTVDLYDYDQGFAPAAIVNYAAEGSGISPMDVKLDSPVAFVNNVTRALDSEGEKTYAITLFKDGTEQKFFLSSNIVPYFEEKHLIPEKGDVMQYATDGLGNIAGINLIKYNKTTGLFSIDFSKTGDTILSQNTFISGKMYSVSSTHIGFKAASKPGPFSGVDPNNDIVFKSSSGQKYVIYDIEKDEMRVGTFADVKTILSVGEDEASDVIMYLSWSNPQIIGVYH